MSIIARFTYSNPIRLGARYLSQVYTKSVKTERLGGSDEGILVVGLSWDVGKNSLSRNMVEELESVFSAAKHDGSLRTLLIKSNVPKVFCAGADLKERLTMSENDVRIFVNRLRGLMKSIEESPVPVIAAINGAALGGGLEMALSCDIRVAAETAKIGLVETKLGIIPGAGGTQRLSRIIGPARAKELIFTAKILNGKEAEAFGVVNHCVSRGQNADEDPSYNKALEIAREILPNGPLSVKMAKIAVDRGIEMDISNGCIVEELCYSRVITSKDRVEGLKAFAEKRKPVYTGE